MRDERGRRLSGAAEIDPDRAAARWPAWAEAAGVGRASMGDALYCRRCGAPWDGGGPGDLCGCRHPAPAPIWAWPVAQVRAATWLVGESRGVALPERVAVLAERLGYLVGRIGGDAYPGWWLSA